MKKLMLTLVLLMLAWMLAAQTGLFSLYFDQSYTEAKTALETDTYAYKEISNVEGTCIFTSETNDYVDQMKLLFVNDKLVAWQIFFNELEDEDIEALIIDSAEEWHGTEEIWDDEYECWVWVFDDKKSLYLGYNYDYYYVAEYFNKDYAGFSELLFW